MQNEALDPLSTRAPIFRFHVGMPYLHRSPNPSQQHHQNHPTQVPLRAISSWKNKDRTQPMTLLPEDAARRQSIENRPPSSRNFGMIMEAFQKWRLDRFKASNWGLGKSESSWMIPCLVPRKPPATSSKYTEQCGKLACKGRREEDDLLQQVHHTTSRDSFPFWSLRISSHGFWN